MIQSENTLFTTKRLFDIFHAQLKSSQFHVDEISKEKFVNNTDEEINNYIFSKMEIIPLKIYEEKIVRSEPREFKLKKRGPFDEIIEMPAVMLEISFPFTGNKELWKCQPSRFLPNPPRGDVIYTRVNDLQGNLKITLAYYQDEFIGENVNKDIKSVLDDIGQYLITIESDIAKHNELFKQQITQQVRARRERLNAIFEETKIIKIPLKRKEDAPDVSHLPVYRKKIPVLSENNGSQEQSYAINDQAYREILNLIRHQCATYERTPRTYVIHNEEELRDILLAQLNGQFEGQATGEAFRVIGKTDICIEAKNRAAFVAECKVWQGKEVVLKAIDQLLGYLTWRDVKTALVIFNKEVAGFMAIQKEISEIIKSHPNFISIDTTNGGSEWHVRLRSTDDSGSFFEVHVFLFNLYVKKEKGGNNEQIE